MNKLTKEQLDLNVANSTDHNYPSYSPNMAGQAKVSELPESKPLMSGKPVKGFGSNMPATQIYIRNP